MVLSCPAHYLLELVTGRHKVIVEEPTFDLFVEY
jgi:hypothetical protein